jgi:hypothetical protein
MITTTELEQDAEAERIRREFVGYTRKGSEIVPVLWDEFVKELGPREIGEAKERLAELIRGATGRHLRVVFETFDRLGKLI